MDSLNSKILCKKSAQAMKLLITYSYDSLVPSQRSHKLFLTKLGFWKPYLQLVTPSTSMCHTWNKHSLEFMDLCLHIPFFSPYVLFPCKNASQTSMDCSLQSSSLYVSHSSKFDICLDLINNDHYLSDLSNLKETLYDYNFLQISIHSTKIYKEIMSAP